MLEEKEHLEYTIDKFSEIIADSNLKLQNLRQLYINNYEAMLEEKFRLQKEINSIEKAKQNPYFARIDFQTNNINNMCYIGKKGISDYENNIIVVDWRAPISSLYYDSNIGNSEYMAPEGVIKGDLKLKRQYIIENGKLVNFNDVDTVSNDELLKPYLSVNADNRLKNIVATIQHEQNKIIRDKLFKNLVIQGVAGSGKTTVALHRIAYLVYNNRDIYKPSDYMVIGPNKFFASYISTILPDLDVDGVCQKTLEELFLYYLGEDYEIVNSLDKLDQHNKYSNSRVSMKLKYIIDEYFDNLQIIPDKDLKIQGISILDKKIILDIYNNINKNMYISVESKINRCTLLINKYIDDNRDKILSRLIKNGVDKKVINELKNNLKTHLKKHFSVLNKKVKEIYKEILISQNYDIDCLDKNIVDIEDIPSLLYIKYKLNESTKLDNYRHIVIDEAQDYGEFTFYALKKIFKNASFSIYGDLAQSIYSYRSINNWECLNEIFENLEIIKLNKSYRTTVEIMNEANKVNKLLNLDEAIPVIRHGEKVKYLETCEIFDIVNELKNKFKTVAIITKTNKDAKKVFDLLKNKVQLNYITIDNLNYDSNISVLPSYLSKGLEFDAVIIVEANKFNKNNHNDLKLFYVSMTRALHELYIVNKDFN